MEGNRIVLFYPQEKFNYAADIFVELLQDDVTLVRSSFHVRDLPTLVEGFVKNQYHNFLKDITVSIPQTGHETKTNENGHFQ